MDIQEIQKKKEELKEAIYGMITKFEKETEMEVHRIRLNRDNVITLGEYSSRTLLSNINIDVRL